MLFNSYVFLFLFLPVVLVGYLFLCRQAGKAPALSWLVLASLFFYGWWHPAFLLLLLASVGTNYVLGLWIRQQTGGRQRLLLAAAVTANLAAQIEDPRDIQRPRPMTPADAGRRTVVLDLYRGGKPTSAEAERLIRETAVSRAVN